MKYIDILADYYVIVIRPQNVTICFVCENTVESLSGAVCFKVQP